MADSKMVYKGDKGFWIHESFMQLAFHYIYDELIKTPYDLALKNDLLYSMKFHIDGYSSGSMSLGWSKMEHSDEQIMLQALSNVIVNLRSKGAYISVSELRQISSDDDDFKILYSRKSFPTAELVKIIDALIEMLQGTWNSNNYSMDIDYAY